MRHRSLAALIAAAFGGLALTAAPPALAHDGTAPDSTRALAADVLGVKNVMVLRVYFNDYSATSRYSRTQVETMMGQISTLYANTSYGKASTSARVSDLYKLPKNRSSYIDDFADGDLSNGSKYGLVLTDAIANAPAGLDWTNLSAIMVVMAETNAAQFHRGQGGKCTLPQGPGGSSKLVGCAIFSENPSDADIRVWGRWAHEVGHAFQQAGPAHPSNYNSAFELMDANYPGQTGVFEKESTQGFPGWLPETKYVNFTKSAAVGPPGAGVGGGVADVWAMEHDPAGKPNPQAVRAFITGGLYYLISVRRKVLGDDLNGFFTPNGIPDEGVMIERVVLNGDTSVNDCSATDPCYRWVALQPPPGGNANKLWTCGQTYNNSADGIYITVNCVGATVSDPDRRYVTVRFTGGGQPDVMVVPWRSRPANAWETSDIWVDSPVNGYGTFRYGTWASLYGDSVPRGNGDDPAVGQANRIYARVRNIGTSSASNIVVHFDITDPPGKGINGSNGFKLLGSVDKNTFPALANLAAGTYTDVYIAYDADVKIDVPGDRADALDQGPGVYAFHTCLRVRIDAVAGETVLGNQDGTDEQENIGYFEIVSGGGGLADGPQAAQTLNDSFVLRNFDAASSRSFRLAFDPDVPAGWGVTVNGGNLDIDLAAGEARPVPVVIEPLAPLPPVGSRFDVDIEAIYERELVNTSLPLSARKHREYKSLGGVTVEARVVAPSSLECRGLRAPDGSIWISGTLTADPAYRHEILRVMLQGAAAGRRPLPPTSNVVVVQSDGRFEGFLFGDNVLPQVNEAACFFAGTSRLAAARAYGPVDGTDLRRRLYFEAGHTVVGTGETADVEVRVRDVQALYAGQLDIRFDPAIVEIVDQDPVRAGVQIEPGDFPAPDQIFRNNADNAAGQLQYYFSLQGPKPGVSGSGRIARIRVRGKQVGVSPLEFTQVVLSDPQSAQIDVPASNGRVTVVYGGRPVYAVRGKVRLERRQSNAGARVCVDTNCTTTDAAGNYVLADVEDGKTVEVTHISYLRSLLKLNHPGTLPGETVDLPDVKLLSGDIVKDDVVNIRDAREIGIRFNVAAGDAIWREAADITDDDRINILDMTGVQYNYDKTAPAPWLPFMSLDRSIVPPDGFARRPRAGGLRPRPGPAPAAKPGGAAVPDAADGPSQGTVVKIEPATKKAGLNVDVPVDIVVDNVAKLYAAEVVVTFDPAIVEVQDASASESGVQIQVGPFLDPINNFVLMNDVDNVQGRVRFAITQTRPATARNGKGVLGTIVFRGKAAGTSPVHFESEILVDDTLPEGLVIPAGATDGEIVIAPGGYLKNISTRSFVDVGDKVMIGGFIIEDGPAKVVVRAIGPSLPSNLIPNRIADPKVRLIRMSDAAVIAANDNWGDSPQHAEIAADPLKPANPKEAMLILTLEKGAYTAIVDGAGGATGVGLVEVFYVSGAGSLKNISTRAGVRTGDEVMIGGFIVRDGPTEVAIRAMGPSLPANAVPDRLMNPTLQLYSGQTMIAQNDDWAQAPNAALIAADPLKPQQPHESMMITTLDPGAYTAIVRGVGGTTGIGLVEVFKRNPPKPALLSVGAARFDWLGGALRSLWPAVFGRT